MNTTQNKNLTHLSPRYHFVLLETWGRAGWGQGAKVERKAFLQGPAGQLWPLTILIPVSFLNLSRPGVLRTPQKSSSCRGGSTNGPVERGWAQSQASQSGLPSALPRGLQPRFCPQNGDDSTSWSPGVWKGKPMKSTERRAPLTLQQLSQD